MDKGRPIPNKHLLKFLLGLCLVLGAFNSEAGAKALIQGQYFLSLPEIAKKLDLQFKWAKKGEIAYLERNKARISASKGDRFIIVNGTKIWLGTNVRLHKRQLCIEETDFKRILAPLVVPHYFGLPPQLKRIVIDPGHGGKDHGTTNKAQGIMEKQMALDVSKRLKSILEKQGYQVSLTRSHDQFISLKERPKIANTQKADLFVSVHFNSVAKSASAVKGVETYALTLQNQPSTSSHKKQHSDNELFPGNRNDPSNSLLAYNVQRNLRTSLGASDRGVKRARFAVLKTLDCPGVLVEAGFISNPEECKNIGSSAYRQKIAEAIGKGIMAYHYRISKANKV